MLGALAGILVGLLAGFPLAVAVHESGHFLAVLCLGFHCRSYVLGPLEISRTGGIRWNRKWTLVQYGGLVHFEADEMVSLRKFAVVLLAGPAANLIVGLLVRYVWRVSLLPLMHSGNATMWPMVVDMIALLNLGMVCNLFPFVRKGLLSDGAQFLLLLKLSRRV
jgi:hypothetical protein